MAKIGITSFAFRYRASQGTPPTTLLELAAGLGVEVFQLCENTGILDKKTGDLESLRRQAKGLGLELEVGVSGSGGQGVRKALDVAQELGARIVRAVVDGGGVSVEETVRWLTPLLTELERADLYLCVENHFRFTPEEVGRLIRSLNHGRVRVCLDPLNSLARLVGPEETVRTLAPYAKTAHIKDASIGRKGAGWVLTGAPLGEGQVDLEGYLRALPADLESVLLESWMDPGDTPESTLQQEMDWAVRGMDWLRKHRSLVGQRRT